MPKPTSLILLSIYAMGRHSVVYMIYSFTVGVTVIFLAVCKIDSIYNFDLNSLGIKLSHTAVHST